MKNQHNPTSLDEKAKEVMLDKRLEDFGWGALLVVIGGIWLLPEKHVSRGSWLIAAGVILLGLNVIRYFNRVRMSGFSLIAGLVALFAGVGAFFNLNLPLLPMILIVIGGCMLLKPLLEKNSSGAVTRSCCGTAPMEAETRNRTTVGR